MSYIDAAVWLPLAKRLPVGRTTRVAHKGDRTTRPNLIIGHEAGKYWCYCQSCHKGAVVEKTHISVVGAQAPRESTQLSLPDDRVLVKAMDDWSVQSIADLLASKNMDALYLPPLWFSESRKRLLLDTGQGWLGRDTTDRSDQKWLTYQGSKYLGTAMPSTLAVVVEDPYSYYKVQWAMRHASLKVSVYCALGTGVRPVLALRIAAQHTRAVLYMDGDKPGVNGAASAARKLKGLGVQAISRCAPWGFDPKDQTCEQIREHLNEAFDSAVR